VGMLTRVITRVSIPTGTPPALYILRCITGQRATPSKHAHRPKRAPEEETQP
jgi:hypothetical protein